MLQRKVWINQQVVTVYVSEPFWPSGQADSRLAAWDGGSSIPRFGTHFVFSFVDPGHCLVTLPLANNGTLKWLSLLLILMLNNSGSEESTHKGDN